jgi:hypothetical protein
MTIGVATSLTVAGCDDALNITNLNNPDVERAFATPVGVETIVSKLFQQMHTGQYLNLPAGGGDNLWTQSMTMSFESSSQLGNFGMGTRGDIPRGLIDNTIGNREEVGNFRDSDHLTRNARMAANAIDAMATFAEEGRTLGQRRDLRTKSFAYFTLAYAHGFLSLFYDSVSVVWPGELTGTEVGEFSSAAQGMTAALAMLDSALLFLSQDTASAAFIPSAWLAQSADMSKDQYRRVLRSYKARFRAGVGRTPTERAAADWNAILADATNGITSDLNVTLSVSGGWVNAWIVQAAVSSGWHQITPFIFGMADTSRAYDTWLATPLDSRAPFLIKTPDRRFPAGETRAEQQAKVSATSPVIAPDTILYIRNRPSGQDTPAEAWGTSYYDFVRFWRVRNHDWREAGGVGRRGPQALLARDVVGQKAAGGLARGQPFAARQPRPAAAHVAPRLHRGAVLGAGPEVRGRDHDRPRSEVLDRPFHQHPPARRRLRPIRGRGGVDHRVDGDRGPDGAGRVREEHRLDNGPGDRPGGRRVRRIGHGCGRRRRAGPGRRWRGAAAVVAASQGNRGPPFGRLWSPSGPLIQVLLPSVKAVQLSDWRQTNRPPVVRCSALRLAGLKRSSSRQLPTTSPNCSRMSSRSVAKPREMVQA